MRTLKLLCAALFVAATAAAAWAGGCGGGGWGCQNKCPVAQKAAQCRSFGTECPAAKDAHAGLVMKNLEKI
jgi:hypothetical protein